MPTTQSLYCAGLLIIHFSLSTADQSLNLRSEMAGFPTQIRLLLSLMAFHLLQAIWQLLFDKSVPLNGVTRHRINW